MAKVRITKEVEVNDDTKPFFENRGMIWRLG